MSPSMNAYHRNRFASMAGKPLTSTEQRILELVAEGRTNLEIGDELSATVTRHANENSVKWALREMSAKLGANSRAHLVHLAHLSGLLPAKKTAAS